RGWASRRADPRRRGRAAVAARAGDGAGGAPGIRPGQSVRAGDRQRPRPPGGAPDRSIWRADEQPRTGSAGAGGSVRAAHVAGHSIRLHLGRISGTAPLTHAAQRPYRDSPDSVCAERAVTTEHCVHEDRRRFIDATGAFFTRYGAAATVGRVFALLLTSDDPLSL